MITSFEIENFTVFEKLEFELSPRLNVIIGNNGTGKTHFDDDKYHAGSTVQRVDFIAEYADHYHFIEVKDPDIPTAANPAAFAAKLSSGKLIQSLVGKYRDTLFFRSFQDKTDKKIVYIVLLSMRALDAAMLVAKQDELRRSIPLTHADWFCNSAATYNYSESGTMEKKIWRWLCPTSERRC